MKFRATLQQTDRTATGIRIPDEVVEGLGSGKRPRVRVTINGATYRSTVAVMGGEYWVGLSAENRALTGAAGGDKVDVEMELDDAAREVAVPVDFAAALEAEPNARRTFDGLSYSNKSWHPRPRAGPRCPAGAVERGAGCRAPGPRTRALTAEARDRTPAGRHRSRRGARPPSSCRPGPGAR
ncbi:MAG: YdeI/OmpD-associated family protein [Chloroflexi bacterium]|nr:YdeI/OmpD-associated family protein [Chloroflexota bacterium]